MSWPPEHDFDTDEWPDLKRAAYDVNHLYEQVESEAAKAHIEDAVISLKSALKAENAGMPDEEA